MSLYDVLNFTARAFYTSLHSSLHNCVPRTDMNVCCVLYKHSQTHSHRNTFLWWLRKHYLCVTPWSFGTVFTPFAGSFATFENHKSTFPHQCTSALFSDVLVLMFEVTKRILGNLSASHLLTKDFHCYSMQLVGHALDCILMWWFWVVLHNNFYITWLFMEFFFYIILSHPNLDVLISLHAPK